MWKYWECGFEARSRHESLQLLRWITLYKFTWNRWLSVFSTLKWGNPRVFMKIKRTPKKLDFHKNPVTTIISFLFILKYLSFSVFLKFWISIISDLHVSKVLIEQHIEGINSSWLGHNFSISVTVLSFRGKFDNPLPTGAFWLLIVMITWGGVEMDIYYWYPVDEPGRLLPVNCNTQNRPQQQQII